MNTVLLRSLIAALVFASLAALPSLWAQAPPTPPPVAAPSSAAPTAEARTLAEQKLALPTLAKLRVGRQATTKSYVVLRRTPAIPKGSVAVEAQTKVRLEEASPDMPGWWKVAVLTGKSRGSAGWAPESVLHVEEDAVADLARRASLLREQQPMPEAVAAEIAPQRAAELAQINLLIKSTDARERIFGYKRLRLTGIEDEPVFDDIARRLLDSIGAGKVLVERSWGRALAGASFGLIGSAIYDQSNPGQAQLEKENRRERADQAGEGSAMASALAYSGNPKYRPALEYIASPDTQSGKRIAGHAQRALDELDQYAYWNAIINSGAGHVPGQPWRITRIRTMLRSGERSLIREALNRVVAEDPPQPALYETVAEVLLKSYQDDFSDDEREDTVALLVKTLGRSRDPRYLATLKTVGDGTKSGKVRDYVESATAALSASAN